MSSRMYGWWMRRGEARMMVQRARSKRTAHAGYLQIHGSAQPQSHQDGLVYPITPFKRPSIGFILGITRPNSPSR